MTRARQVLAASVGAVVAIAGGLRLLALQPPAVQPPLTPAQMQLARALYADVSTLADTIGERNASHPLSLVTTADWLGRDFAGLGYAVERQAFTAQKRTDENVIATAPGVPPGPHEVVVVGAHYDTVEGAPGANDNGSGVAALRAIARALAGHRFQRELRFVAFANEEYGFQTDEMGSRVYARRCRDRHEQIAAMVCLETLGYYSTAAGSQRYPLPALALLYPDRGDFVGVVGNWRSLPLAREVTLALRERTTVAAQWAALPEAVPGATWSDHSSFWQEGFPAVMVTDTAPFRYDFYHTAQDTPDKLDYKYFARVVEALIGVVGALAGST